MLYQSLRSDRWVEDLRVKIDIAAQSDRGMEGSVNGDRWMEDRETAIAVTGYGTRGRGLAFAQQSWHQTQTFIANAKPLRIPPDSHEYPEIPPNTRYLPSDMRHLPPISRSAAIATRYPPRGKWVTSIW